jgi:hypothetical protein
MCGLCGALGIDSDWTDAAATFSSAYSSRTKARARALSTCAEAVQPCPPDWEGAKYQLGSRTGRTEIVDNLAQVWQAAERILGRACDPLDLSVIARMKQIRRID